MTGARRCRTGGPGATPGMRCAISALRRFRRFPCRVRPFCRTGVPCRRVGASRTPRRCSASGASRAATTSAKCWTVRSGPGGDCGLGSAPSEAGSSVPRRTEARFDTDRTARRDGDRPRPFDRWVIRQKRADGHQVRGDGGCEHEAELGERVSRHGRPHPTVRSKALRAIAAFPPAGTRYHILCTGRARPVVRGGRFGVRLGAAAIGAADFNRSESLQRPTRPPKPVGYGSTHCMETSPLRPDIV